MSNYIIYIVIIALIYYIVTRTEKVKENVIPLAVNPTPLAPETSKIEETGEFTKPKMLEEFKSNYREGFLLWRKPEDAVHKNLLTVNV